MTETTLNTAQRPTKQSLPTAGGLAQLVCPACRGELDQHVRTYRCRSCPKTYPIICGIPRFVPNDDYAGNFSFQWIKHARTQLDKQESRYSEVAFRKKTGFTPEELRGKVVLDVGCGMGRYTEVAARWGARVVGIDLSDAVESARANLAHYEHVEIFQANVFQLPFREASFDYIYSIGVLHHAPDCEAAFRCLPPLLKPGGKLSVWLYSNQGSLSYRMSDLCRKLTTRLPQRLLYALCHFAGPLGAVDALLRRLGLTWLAKLLHLAVPYSTHPRWHWRVLDTFDWYSPRYQSKHSKEELLAWFESEGLIHNRVLEVLVSVQGQRPEAQNP